MHGLMKNTLNESSEMRRTHAIQLLSQSKKRMKGESEVFLTARRFLKAFIGLQKEDFQKHGDRQRRSKQRIRNE